MATKKSITESKIISAYMDVVLETGNQPTSIYAFSKSLNIEEELFYNHFTSFDELEKRIFELFGKNTIELISKNEEFIDYETKNKLLTFYYTLIEIMTANRSYILVAFGDSKDKLQNLKKLHQLKSLFNEFTNTLDFESIDLKQPQLEKIQAKGKQEILWVQLLIIIKFWIDDHSKSFEKTDIFIEKSVHALFDIIDTKPLKSFLDFGKFIMKEKMNFKM